MALGSASRVMNGTWGQIWEDGSEIVEVSAFQVKVTKNFETLNLCRQMAEDRKLVGVKITGSMTLHKVYTRGTDDVTAAMSGQDLRKTLVGKLADPDAYGAERVAVYGVSYDEQTVMDWQAAKVGSITIPFQATGLEYLDVVGA
jgi:UDP-N-acetyl-D-mannosaminuronic acid transferase (WecB/TagA/CpsF family)